MFGLVYYVIGKILLGQQIQMLSSMRTRKCGKGYKGDVGVKREKTKMETNEQTKHLTTPFVGVVASSEMGAVVVINEVFPTYITYRKIGLLL